MNYSNCVCINVKVNLLGVFFKIDKKNSITKICYFHVLAILGSNYYTVQYLNVLYRKMLICKC